ncbi:FAD:protein FMN transferase [Brevundimonas sp.]|uniref:FAD:protein FMN transferase n=1 Tax=Brevundimonas sp. TaxID=1871086 RepID=UPI002D69A815|nr:FAD:protein FMN transferase [Brevundimonas sp.]HYC67212.1 FAD:protein FMN transferase [Brevundimonas sp.]
MTDHPSAPRRSAPPPMLVGEDGLRVDNRLLIPTHGKTPTQPPSGLIWDLSGETLGAIWNVRLAPPADLDRADCQIAIEEELKRIILLFSHEEPRSELSRLNAAPPGFWAVSEPFWSLLNTALDLADDTNGAFDPTLGALVELWGHGPPGSAPGLPSGDEIAAALALSGWGRLRLNRDARAVQQLGGVKLDLSGAVRGHAVDRISDRLTAMGATHHLVGIGGELRGAGVKPGGHPWWAPLPQPAGGRAPRTAAALFDMAMATSGGGNRLIDGHTGRPVDDEVVSVTVLADTALYADAMTTALVVMGPAEGPAFAEAMNIAAAFAVRGEDGLLETVTPAFVAMLKEGA